MKEEGFPPARGLLSQMAFRLPLRSMASPLLVPRFRCWLLFPLSAVLRPRWSLRGKRP